jgi:hypothetical protein
LREVKRNAEVGEKIKIVVEHGGWQPAYKLNEIWTVKKKWASSSIKPNDFSRGIVGCIGNECLIFPEDYVVLEED